MSAAFRVPAASFALAALILTFPPASTATFAANCDGDSTGLIPLSDLGAAHYQGFSGGLYGGGSNLRPPPHDAAGLALAGAMAPLDTLGNPNANGAIVLISIGMSNATQEFSAFVPKANADPLKNSRVHVIDCAKGGQATQDIRHPDAAYWDTVATRLRGRGASPAQVQVAWIKEARRTPSEPFPASAESLSRDLGAIVRLLKSKLPNLKLAYLTSRIYAGYASTTLNPEPYAYESGFAVRWLIEAQIAGEDSLNFDPGSGPVEAPWLAWGPYLWADGLEGRSDGLTWACSDFSADGTHPSNSGRNKVADALLEFFKTDPTTMPWFLGGTVGVDGEPAARISLAVWPNPSRGDVIATVVPPAGPAWRAEILDVGGRRVATVGSGTGDGRARMLRWSGAGGRAGVYWLRVVSDRVSVARRIVMLGK
jgi:hypothetical protein